MRTWRAGSEVGDGSGDGVAFGEAAGFGVARVRPGVAARVGSAVASTRTCGEAVGFERKSAIEGSLEELRYTSIPVAITTNPKSIAVAKCHQRNEKPRVRPSKGRPHHSHVSAWGELRP
jgi:hypothetical protein